MSGPNFSGALVPVLTPFKADLSPDTPRFVGLCKALLAEGAGGLAVFGTTSESNSLSTGEKRGLLEALVDGGVPAEKLMPGVGANSIITGADNIAACVEAGCGGSLMLPPFYYKNVTDDGVFGFVSEAINRASAKGTPQIYLYHIPPQAVIGFSLDLIERLLEAFPGVIVGLKDSSGDMGNTIAMLERFENFDVFCGSEEFLLETMRHGGVGCITATGNINIAEIARLADTWQDDDADDQQGKLTNVRKAFQRKAPIPMMKRYLAHKTGHQDWAVVRPPLEAVGDGEIAGLEADLAKLGYSEERFYASIS